MELTLDKPVRVEDLEKAGFEYDDQFYWWYKPWKFRENMKRDDGKTVFCGECKYIRSSPGPTLPMLLLERICRTSPSCANPQWATYGKKHSGAIVREPTAIAVSIGSCEICNKNNQCIYFEPLEEGNQ